MRIPRAVFLASILVGPLALHAAQSPAPGAAPPAAAAPAPTASETLKPALVGVLQTLGSLKLDKWKRGSVREEAGSNIDTIQRDLEETLPPLLKAADAAPTTISKVLPVTRNIDAIYDVLVHVFEAARVSAPGDQIAQLQQAMDSLEKARIKFGNHLQDTAAGTGKIISGPPDHRADATGILARRCGYASSDTDLPSARPRSQEEARHPCDNDLNDPNQLDHDRAEETACNDPFCCHSASYTSENSVAGSEDNKDAATEAAASLCSTGMSKCWLEVQFHAQLNLPLAVHEIGVGIGHCSEAGSIYARALRRLIDKRIGRRS